MSPLTHSSSCNSTVSSNITKKQVEEQIEVSVGPMVTTDTNLSSAGKHNNSDLFENVANTMNIRSISRGNK